MAEGRGSSRSRASRESLRGQSINWFEGGAEADTERVQAAMEKRYGKAGH